MPATPEPPLHWEDCRLVPEARLPPPRGLAREALASGEEWVALLESGGGLQHRSRYSLVALGARERVIEEGPERAYDSLATLTSGSRCRGLPCRDPVFFLLGYEAFAGEEHWLLAMLGRHDWPALVAFKPEALVVYDHAGGRVAVCPGDYSLPLGGRAGNQGGGSPGFRAEGPVYSTRREAYESWVEQALEEIARGEAFQIVLSRVERYRVKGDLFAAYERLATLNPSPYLFFMRLGGLSALGSSPELLVKLENGRLETHPIAGTRPRGRTPEEDIDLELDLVGDEKERAEHVMLVDLARNDLARAAVPGTVEVTTFMDVERYESVMHIVSRVEARARPGAGFVDALRATHPAGTVSGAPKPRAMEIIARLEEEPRGPYAGAVGVASDSAGEAAIVIRSAWLLPDGETLEIRAGAGIVYDSRPDKEYMETVHKLASLKRALGVA